eukprot:1359588-Amorphochlora_amoeboformis.AAC.2
MSAAPRPVVGAEASGLTFLNPVPSQTWLSQGPWHLVYVREPHHRWNLRVPPAPCPPPRFGAFGTSCLFQELAPT